MADMKRRDRREHQAEGDCVEREVPRRVEAGSEFRGNQVAEARDKRPDRGLPEGDPLVVLPVYDFFFPCSS
jgi:hypothetical protein